MATLAPTYVGHGQAFGPIFRAVRSFPGINMSIQTGEDEGRDAQRCDKKWENNAKELSVGRQGVCKNTTE